jgi:GINS complex subunit 3
MASSGSQSFSGGHSFTPFTTSSGSSSSFLSSSFTSADSYFSVDDILASQQKIPVRIEVPIYRLGFLNQSADEEHLKAGLKMELPFWLTKVLGSKARNIVHAELPKQYKRGQREILSADANVVDLYKMGPYYYSLGLKLLCFEHLETKDVSKSLLETFLNRFRQIMDNSQNADMADTYTLTAKLDEMERLLFALGQQATQQLGQWERGSSHKITSALALQRRRKRRHPSQ